MANEIVVPPEEKFSLSVKLLLAAGAVLVVVAAAVAGYFFAQNKNNNNQKLTENSLQNTSSSVNNQPVEGVVSPTSTNNANTEPISINFPTTSLSQEIAAKINWTQPNKLNNLRWFVEKKSYAPENSEYEVAILNEYYEVGTFEYNGERGRVVLVQIQPEEPSSPWYFYILDFKKQFTVLAKYSWFDGYANKQFDSNPGSTLEAHLANFVPEIKKLVKVDLNFTIPALEFPKTIKGPKERQALNLRGVYPLQERVGFSNVTVKAEVPVFVDPQLGTVYTSAVTGGFYVHGPDGTRAAYALEPDFFNPNSAQAQIIWNDGSWNGYEYMYGDQGGCGAMNYISVVTSTDITLASDLAIVGKNSKGDTIYELKDKNHRLLKSFYGGAYFPQQDGYKISYEEFVTLKPIIFWVDPFGRLIKMTNRRFIIPAECGKPVIYLYPEKTINVSVRVEPKGGMSVSDPFYNGGWEVRAEPSGQLTELKSNKKYPYLFWEGQGDLYQQPEQGFIMKREDVGSQLPKKLTQLGLHTTEIKDFMEFWHPRMQEKPYYFVTFLGTEQMNQLAPLTVSPQPDTVVRILMDFTPLDEPKNVVPLPLGSTPERKGFTVIEWGGVIRK